MQNKALKLAEYFIFVDWYAKPRFLREPATQQLFSDAYGVSHDTLARWKKDPEFNDDVLRATKSWMDEHIGDVLAATYQSAIKGDVDAQKFLITNWRKGLVDKKTENTETKEIGTNLAAVLLAAAQAQREREAAAMMHPAEHTVIHPNGTSTDPDRPTPGA
jgi:hypothetical protein